LPEVNQAGLPADKCDLVKVGTDWRIADITWQRDGKSDTLRALYAHQSAIVRFKIPYAVLP
jgi:hypothetical protein